MNNQNDYTNCPCQGCVNYRAEKGIPEPMSKYTQKMREIAELISRSTEPDRWEAIDRKIREGQLYGVYSKEVYIQKYMSAAREVINRLTPEYNENETT